MMVLHVILWVIFGLGPPIGILALAGYIDWQVYHSFFYQSHSVLATCFMVVISAMGAGLAFVAGRWLNQEAEGYDGFL